jgi:hypothetical protein
VVLAAHYRVRDFSSWWASLAEVAPENLIAARYLVVYRGLEDPNQVFVTVGVDDDRPVSQLLTSPDVLRWFDLGGVADLPPIFAGHVVEKLNLLDSPADFHGSSPVIVAGIVRMSDFDRYWELIRSAPRRLRKVGVTRYWAYRALDDPDEVMFLEEVETEDQALRWTRHRDAASAWFSQAGIGEYPPLFIGRIVQTIELPRRPVTAAE